MDNSEPLALEPADGGQVMELRPDRRARLYEPLPVRLVAVSDVRLASQIGLEGAMDRLYVEILGFVYVQSPGELVYRADNFYVHFDLFEQPPQRGCYRNLQVEVPSLADLEPKLVDAEIEYAHQRGLLPGSQSLLLMDPCGNRLEVAESRRVM